MIKDAVNNQPGGAPGGGLIASDLCALSTVKFLDSKFGVTQERNHSFTNADMSRVSTSSGIPTKRKLFLR